MSVIRKITTAHTLSSTLLNKMKQNLREEAKSIFPAHKPRREEEEEESQKAIPKVQQSRVSNLAVTWSRIVKKGCANVRVLAQPYVDPFQKVRLLTLEASTTTI